MTRAPASLEDGPAHVSIVAIPDAVISTLSGIYDVMNAFEIMAGLGPGPAGSPPFVTEIVGQAIGLLDVASGVPVKV